MNEAGVKLFSDEPNMPVVQVAGRRFPGVVIQGDTLKNLLCESRELGHAMKSNDRDEANEILIGIIETLETVVVHYEKTLAKEGVDLPYASSPEHERQ